MLQRARQQYPIVQEQNVPMTTRDGVVLRADIVRPDAPGRFPVLLRRTPYGKVAEEFYARFGYVTVVQDCRGRFASEGEYYPFFNDVNDGYDAVEWAARLPWSNGRVGTFGQSYPGATQYLIACHDPMPPQLQAMVPVSAAADYHEGWVYHSGGAMLWGWAVPYAILKGRNTLERVERTDLFRQMEQYGEPGPHFGRPLRAEGYRHLPLREWGDRLREAAPYFADFLSHPDDGEYWWPINVLRHLPSIRVPMLHVSSWYDIFLAGALTAYQGIKAHGGTEQARRGQRLIVGPWGHLFPYHQPSSRGTGEIDFGPEALIDLLETQLRWFDYWLKDKQSGILDGPPVTVFVMGENRWQTLDDWPPPDAQFVRYYLHSEGTANTVRGNGTLSTAPPTEEPPDAYLYDPNDPVPTLGGNNLTIPFGVYDQRPVEERPDVLVYTSAPLDRPLEVTGPIRVHLWAATTAPDTDFTAKLVDVHPDGYARNLQDGIIRARYRTSREHPTLVEPGQTNEYAIDLWATSNVFRPGHRIRVEISSSNFPRFDRNQNTGASFGADDRLAAARQTIFHRFDSPSHILLPVRPR